MSLHEAVDSAIAAWRADYSFVGADPLPKGAAGKALSTRLVETVQTALQKIRDIEIEGLNEEIDSLDAKVRFMEARMDASNISTLEELEEAYLILAVLAQKLLVNTKSDAVTVTEDDRQAAVKATLTLDRDDDTQILSIKVGTGELARSLE